MGIAEVLNVVVHSNGNVPLGLRLCAKGQRPIGDLVPRLLDPRRVIHERVVDLKPSLFFRHAAICERPKKPSRPNRVAEEGHSHVDRGIERPVCPEDDIAGPI